MTRDNSNAVAFGIDALKYPNGDKNIAVGAYAMYGGASTATASENTAIGHASLYQVNGGNKNSALGRLAGYNITSGDNNTFIGYKASGTGTNDITTGSNNTLIGYEAQATSATVSNEITLGNTSITKFRIPGISLEASASAVTQGGVFYENNTTVSANYTITNGRNAMAAGPITIASGVVVTVGSGETLTIV